MRIVSNTSPLTNLAAIGSFELLRGLFGEIFIAEGVWTELNAGGHAYPGSREVSEASWVHIQKVNNRPLIATLQRDLDLGEAETLALALDVEADLVLLDEREGRRVAARLGFETMGILGILHSSKRKGLIGNLQEPMDALRRKAGFYIGDGLYHRLLAEADEKPAASRT